MFVFSEASWGVYFTGLHRVKNFDIIVSMLKAKSVTNDLKKLGTPARAKASAWYFKTEKGQYGHGDIFFGVTVPEQRQIAKKYSSLSLGEILKLLKSKIHECRLTGLLILVLQYKNAAEKEKDKIVKFYLSNAKKVNNWDLVDCSASYILGDSLVHKDKSVLYKLAKSENLWEKRISIVSTFAFIKEGIFDDSLRIAELLIADSHDLIHKAVGWMLREVGKKSESTLETFLKKHIQKLPRTTLRYAIERFPEKKRKFYLSLDR